MARTAICPHDCPDTCALKVDGSAEDLRVSGHPTHPHTEGWLCAKVRDYQRVVLHPDRLLRPRKRVGPRGSNRWQDISWQEALDVIASRWLEIMSSHGAAAILPYSYSGTLGLVQNSVASSRLWNRMGASGLIRAICGDAGKLAVRATVGARLAPTPQDLLHSRLIVIWGHNPVVSSPHFMPLLQRAKRRGARVVVIDPRRTATTRRADLHLAPRPSTDGALALGLAQLLAEKGCIDRPYLQRHSVGWEALLQRAKAFPIDRVARITDLPGSQIAEFAGLLADHRPCMIKIADGVQRHENGGQTVRAIAALPALLGQYGIRGGGLFYSTSDTIRWNEEAVGHSAECVPTPRWVNMNRLGAALLGEVSDPPIRSLYVFAANPATSAPHTAAIRRGLARKDLFTVVHELFMTDTAQFADIVLPATSQLEQHDLHKAYGHHVLGYNAPSIEPRGEAKSNWDVMRALAARLGYDDPWLQADAKQVIDEVLDASAKDSPLLAAVDRSGLFRNGYAALPLDEAPPFAEGHFPTPSGKIELHSDAMRLEGVDGVADYQPAPSIEAAPAGSLILISPAPHHFVNSTLAGLDALRKKEGAPVLELHPDEAGSRGIAEGDIVRVSNHRGEVSLPAHLNPGLRTGVASTTKGHWGQFSEDGRSINWLTSDALGDLGGQSTFHSTVVMVRKAAHGEGGSETIA